MQLTFTAHHTWQPGGRVLIYLEDRDAFEPLQEAVRRAEEIADRVFQPLDPPWERLGRV